MFLSFALIAQKVHLSNNIPTVTPKKKFSLKTSYYSYALHAELLTLTCRIAKYT
jgi:hypothetical protein